MLLTLRWRRGPAYFAHESLCNCSVVEVFQPVVVAGLLDLAGATCILAFAWLALALLWRRGPAAFAHELGRAPIVEVLLQAPTEVEGQALQPKPWKGRLKGRE